MGTQKRLIVEAGEFFEHDKEPLTSTFQQHCKVVKCGENRGDTMIMKVNINNLPSNLAKGNHRKLVQRPK
jgi:hypothetical protein